MNARQTKKRLKSKIDELQSDNNLMHRIIADNPNMQELYDLYNKPLFVTHMSLQEYRSKRFLPPERPNDEMLITMFKRELAKDLFDGIKDNITYAIDTECMTPTITASIFVGRK